jgi:HD-GYP domain-containing protein (c-di-GMP phosphodiesterase class II)
VATLERQVTNLRRAPDDRDSIATLFRALHTIKGDASICRFELGVRITHPIESLLVRMREGKLVFSPLLAEAILLALDRLELAVEALLAGRSIESLRLQPLIDGLDLLSTSDNAGLDAGSIAMIEAVTGFRPAGATAKLIPKAAARGHDNASDLRFFQRLALQLESYSPLFKGRSGRLLRLALETNDRAGKPVDAAQLEAAVYMHDVGMMFLPESIWLKVGALTDTERQVMREHPTFAAGLVERMDGWQEAAVMIAHHHEMIDGKGYPLGLKEDQIVPGAKILSIIDAFESVTLKHSHRGEGRSLLRAIAEINASDKQFSAEWIEHFNQVIRGMVEA